MVFKKKYKQSRAPPYHGHLKMGERRGGREKKREMFYLDMVVLSEKAGLRYVIDVLKKLYISISSSELIFK